MIILNLCGRYPKTSLLDCPWFYLDDESGAALAEIDNMANEFLGLSSIQSNDRGGFQRASGSKTSNVVSRMIEQMNARRCNLMIE